MSTFPQSAAALLSGSEPAARGWRASGALSPVCPIPGRCATLCTCQPPSVPALEPDPRPSACTRRLGTPTESRSAMSAPRAVGAPGSLGTNNLAVALVSAGACRPPRSPEPNLYPLWCSCRLLLPSIFLSRSARRFLLTSAVGSAGRSPRARSRCSFPRRVLK